MSYSDQFSLDIDMQVPISLIMHLLDCRQLYFEIDKEESILL